MSQLHYVVTCSPATRVTAAVAGNFVGTERNLVVAKSNAVEISRLEESELVPVLRVPINGVRQSFFSPRSLIIRFFLIFSLLSLRLSPRLWMLCACIGRGTKARTVFSW